MVKIWVQIFSVFSVRSKKIQDIRVQQPFCTPEGSIVGSSCPGAGRRKEPQTADNKCKLSGEGGGEISIGINVRFAAMMADVGDGIIINIRG